MKGFGNRPHKRFDWEAFSLLLLIWLPAGSAGIYAKWAMLRSDGYLKTASQDQWLGEVLDLLKKTAGFRAL
jgi:hypothetical protein